MGPLHEWQRSDISDSTDLLPSTGSVGWGLPVMIHHRHREMNEDRTKVGKFGWQLLAYYKTEFDMTFCLEIVGKQMRIQGKIPISFFYIEKFHIKSGP